MRNLPSVCALLVIVLGWSVSSAIAQTPLGTVFSYQGQLIENGNPANGSYVMLFQVYDAEMAGNQGQRLPLTGWA